MEPTLENITTQYNAVQRELYTIDTTLDYAEVLTLLIELSDMVNAFEGDTSPLWAIGEDEHALTDTMIGAYWFAVFNVDGQTSPEYALVCSIGRWYTSNQASGPQRDSGEVDAYNAMCDIYNAAKPCGELPQEYFSENSE